MNVHSNSQRKQLMSPEEISAVQAKVSAWLDEQNASGGFESSWTGAGSIVGGGFIGVDSTEGLTSAIFG